LALAVFSIFSWTGRAEVNIITARSTRPFGTEDAGLKTREEAGGPHDVASVMGDDYEEVRTSTFAL
jgi:hypothetical protein